MFSAFRRFFRFLFRYRIHDSQRKMIRIVLLFTPVQISLTEMNHLQCFFFLFSHHRFVVFIHMIVSEKMQQAVYSQIHQFTIESVPVLPALPHSGFRRDDDISQQMGFRAADFLRFFRFVQRKRKDIRRPVDTPVIFIQNMDYFVINQRHADFGFCRQFMQFCYRLQPLFQQSNGFFRDLYLVLVVTENNLHTVTPFLRFSFLPASVQTVRRL